MLAAERRDLMLDRLRRDGRLVARDLAVEFGLTDDSVRRDLRDLAAAGLCQRVYGGALRTGAVPDDFTARLALAPESKRLVAQRAAKLITPGCTAILGPGTTNLAVAGALAPDLRATIFASCPLTAAALLKQPNIDVFVLGGRLNRVTQSVSGAASVEVLSGISADLLLIAAAGVHPEQGLTTTDPDDAAMGRLLVSRAADTFILGSSEKLGNVERYRVVRLPEVSGIVTDAPYDDPTVAQLRKHNINVIYAS